MSKIDAVTEPDNRHPTLRTFYPEIRPHCPDTLSFFRRIASNALFFKCFFENKQSSNQKNQTVPYPHPPAQSLQADNQKINIISCPGAAPPMQLPHGMAQ